MATLHSSISSQYPSWPTHNSGCADTHWWSAQWDLVIEFWAKQNWFALLQWPPYISKRSWKLPKFKRTLSCAHAPCAMLNSSRIWWNHEKHPFTYCDQCAYRNQIQNTDPIMTWMKSISSSKVINVITVTKYRISHTVMMWMKITPCRVIDSLIVTKHKTTHKNDLHD